MDDVIIRLLTIISDILFGTALSVSLTFYIEEMYIELYFSSVYCFGLRRRIQSYILCLVLYA